MARDGELWIEKNIHVTNILWKDVKSRSVRPTRLAVMLQLCMIFEGPFSTYLASSLFFIGQMDQGVSIYINSLRRRSPTGCLEQWGYLCIHSLTAIPQRMALAWDQLKPSGHGMQSTSRIYDCSLKGYGLLLLEFFGAASSSRDYLICSHLESGVESW
jgi:hypothetical protein